MTNKELQNILKRFPDNAEILQETRPHPLFNGYIKIEPYQFKFCKNKDVFVGSGLKTKRMKNKILIKLGYGPVAEMSYADDL